MRHRGRTRACRSTPPARSVRAAHRQAGPQPGQTPGPELSGALGDVVRIALAPDQRARFGDLKQLHDAVEVVQPRPPSEGERNILSALRMRFSRPPPEKEALARLIEKLHQLEAR